MNSFVEQFRENCRRRSAMWRQRLVRILAAFLIAALVAPLCYLADSIGGRTAGMVVGIAGCSVGMLTYWMILSWWLNRSYQADLPAEEFDDSVRPQYGPFAPTNEVPQKPSYPQQSSYPQTVYQASVY